MSNLVLKDCKLYWEGYDFSGKMHTVSLPLTQEAKLANVFGVDSNTYIAGTKGFELNVGGYHDNATVLDPDKYIQAEMGNYDTIVTVCPTDGTEGEPAYSMKVATATYTPVMGDYGDVAGFEFNAKGVGTNIFKGIVIHNGEEVGGGVTTAFEIAGMDEGDIAYMAIHCTDLDATSIGFTTYSDTVVTMDDDPTVREFNEATMTAVGAQYLSFTAPAGITTHDCWRVGYGLTGGNTTATFTIVLYIPA